MKVKKILVTGSAGFIGFHVAKKLAECGHTVIGYDNFNDYYEIGLKEARASLLIKQGVTVIRGDICDKNLLEKVVNENSISHIINLAAQAGVRYSLEQPQAYIKSNIEGFVNILETCRKNPEIKLVYASSSSVYGNNKSVPFSIEERTDNQASLYGVTKKSNELLANTYSHLFDISTIGLRFFTVYGPWGRPDMAYFLFTKAILDGEPIPVYHKGTLKRDFTYIDDIVDGTISTLDLESKTELFNLGNEFPVEVRYLITLLEKELGKKAKIEYLPMQRGDVTETFADISHSKKKLKYAPKVPIEEGIKRFVEWYRENYKNALP